MVQYPEVQERAQAEIDGVVGTEDSQISEIDPHCPTLKLFTVRRFGGTLWHH